MINRKISVITPSLNQSRFLEMTIQSIVEQVYPNVELFVMDGGSTDNSLDIINKYNKKIDCWVSEPDQGQSNAINKGFKQCSGEIINWINSDDVLLPGSLEVISAAFSNNPQADFVYGDTLIIDPNGQPVFTLYSLPFDANILKYGGNLFAQPSCFFHRRVLEKIGNLNDDLHWAMDYDFWMRALAAGCKFIQIPYTISAFRIHTHSKSVSHHKKIQNEYFYSYSRNFYSEPSKEGLKRCFYKIFKIFFRSIRVIKIAFIRKKISLFLYSSAVKNLEKQQK